MLNYNAHASLCGASSAAKWIERVPGFLKLGLWFLLLFQGFEVRPAVRPGVFGPAGSMPVVPVSLDKLQQLGYRAQIHSTVTEVCGGAKQA